MSEDKRESAIQYVVRDKPAERGLTINNILLAIVILGGGIFSTVITSYMSHLTASVAKMEESMSTMKSTDSVTANELNHINRAMDNLSEDLSECKEIHIIIRGKLINLETIVYREHGRLDL